MPLLLSLPAGEICPPTSVRMVAATFALRLLPESLEAVTYVLGLLPGFVFFLFFAGLILFLDYGLLFF